MFYERCLCGWLRSSRTLRKWMIVLKRYQAISTHIDGYSYENDNMQFIFPFEEQTKWLNVHLIIIKLCKSS